VGIATAIVLLSVGAGNGRVIAKLIGSGEKKLEREISSYRKGQEGEDAAVEAMRQALDGRWTLFRNVRLSGRGGGDIDAILVGHPGVCALEIKAYSGQYKNYGEHWDYRAGNGWKPLRQSPSRQAKGNAARPNAFLRVDGITQWVNPAVIWADLGSTLSLENPMVAVWTLDHLAEELGNIWHGQKIGDAALTRINEKLTRLCERQAQESA
jgi:hypothetical protein